MCRKRWRASVSAESEGLAAVVALERHVSRHLAHSYTIAHACKKCGRKWGWAKLSL